MNIVEAVQRYVVDRYPIESTWSSWRSAESIAAVQLLTARVAAINAGGLANAVAYLADDVVPGGDAAVAALRPISKSTLTGSEARLYAMLLDVKAALAMPADFVTLHAARVWSAVSVIALVGEHDDTLDAHGWISYFFKERQSWTDVPAGGKAWIVDLLNYFYTRPAVLDLAVGGHPQLANPNAANTFLATHKIPERLDGGPTVMAKMQSYSSLNITHAYRPKADVLEEALVVALRSGFMPIARCDAEHRIVGVASVPELTLHAAWRSNQAWGGTAAQAQVTAQAAIRQTPGVSYCWRGDTRSPDEIRTAGGLWCKAASEAYAARTRMRDAWHPFHREEYRRHLYYRCSQNDNCLYTAVSVTPAVAIAGAGAGAFQFGVPDPNAFRINVTFPQLSTIPEAKRSLVYIDRTGTGTNVGVERLQRYVDHVQLYLCRIPNNATYVDTRALQVAVGNGAGFPEIALRGVRHADLMGYVTFVRIHHGWQDAEGFTAIPVTDRTRNLQPTVAGATALFNAANTQFEIAWGANGPLAPSRPWIFGGANPAGWTITRVGAMDVHAGAIAHWVDYT